MGNESREMHARTAYDTLLGAIPDVVSRREEYIQTLEGLFNGEKGICIDSVKPLFMLDTLRKAGGEGKTLFGDLSISVEALRGAVIPTPSAYDIQVDQMPGTDTGLHVRVVPGDKRLVVDYNTENGTYRWKYREGGAPIPHVMFAYIAKDPSIPTTTYTYEEGSRGVTLTRQVEGNNTPIRRFGKFHWGGKQIVQSVYLPKRNEYTSTGQVRTYSHAITPFLPVHAQVHAISR